MPEFNYLNEERRWKAYYKFERQRRLSFLRSLSQKDTFVILRGLYSYVYNLSDAAFSKLDYNKIKALARVHSLFGKVK